MRRSSVVWLAVALVIAGFSSSAPQDAFAAKKDKDRKLDKFWTHAGIDSYAVDRIALLPATGFNHDIAAEKSVELALSTALSQTDYRWISSTSTRDQLRPGDSDSLLKIVYQAVLKNGYPDSSLAANLCARFRCDALLAVRIDQWDQNVLPYDQSGKSSTSVQIKAALVHSSGTVLWTASGGHTGEGPYQVANANPIGVSGGALERTAVTGQGGAPSYREVTKTIVDRWAPHFPAKPKPAEPAH